MQEQREIDAIRDHVSELLDQAQQHGLRKEDKQAIATEVDLLWDRLSRAKPKKPRRTVPA